MLFIILLCFYVYNGTFSFHLIMGQLMSLYFFHAVVFWLLDPTLVPGLRRYMNQRFGGFCPWRRCLSWVHIAFQMHVKIIQVLFRGCPLLKVLLSSIFSSVWISRDLNPIFWFMYAEIGVELLDGSILAPRSILFCTSNIKCNFETLKGDTHTEDCKICSY